MLAEHAPSTQLSEQHSVATLHALPAGVHTLAAAMQPVCESHRPEQQSALLEQCADTARQSPPGLTPPGPTVSARPPELVRPAPSPAREVPSLPASDAAVEPAVPGLLMVVEPPQPTQSAAEAMRSAPRMRNGRVMAWVNGSLLAMLRGSCARGFGSVVGLTQDYEGARFFFGALARPSVRHASPTPATMARPNPFGRENRTLRPARRGDTLSRAAQRLIGWSELDECGLWQSRC